MKKNIITEKMVVEAAEQMRRRIDDCTYSSQSPLEPAARRAIGRVRCRITRVLHRRHVPPDHKWAELEVIDNDIMELEDNIGVM